MSNRFVSGGTITSSGEVSKEPPPDPTPQPARNREWEAVQQELEAERKQREEARRKAAAGEERSLYDILQANKAAKQAAFEEQTKIRNQFRALDDDEIEFLDEVVAKKRSEEAKVRRETEEGLKAFRERQKGETATVEGERVMEEAEEWGVGRKRKRVRERDVKGVRRKVSESETDAEVVKAKEVKAKEVKGETKVAKSEKEKAPEKRPEQKGGLGLVGYGSDSDD